MMWYAFIMFSFTPNFPYEERRKERREKCNSYDVRE
jgi:hypothetical protein